MMLGAMLLPLGAGLGYACGAIAIKRSLGSGISGVNVNFVCNTLMALLFQIFWIFPGARVTQGAFLAAALCGGLFFLGQIFTFRAIASGDVYVATPLLGTKVILVALFSVAIIGRSLPYSWGCAALLASLGIALISYSSDGVHRRLGATIAWSLGAAMLFALTDVLVQRFVSLSSYSRFAPMMFGVTGIFSLIFFPHVLRSVRRGTDGLRTGSFSPVSIFSHRGVFWLLVGGLLLSIQSLAMYSSIGLYGSATLTNILYGSRCLWSVVLVWMLGSRLGEIPSGEARMLVMGRRLLGALLLFSAMALVL